MSGPGLYRNGRTCAAEEKDDRARCHHVAAMIEDPRIDGPEAERPENGQPADHQENGQSADHDDTVEETVDGLPVLAEVRTIERASPASLPAVQAAAAAATGFVAGAATIALVKRRAARKVQRSRSTPRRAADVLPIVGSRTFLVDVHLLKPE
jgi:hypothetical protein